MAILPNKDTENTAVHLKERLSSVFSKHDILIIGMEYLNQVRPHPPSIYNLFIVLSEGGLLFKRFYL